MDHQSATCRAIRSAISRLLSSFAFPSLCRPFPSPRMVEADVVRHEVLGNAFGVRRSGVRTAFMGVVVMG